MQYQTDRVFFIQDAKLAQAILKYIESDAGGWRLYWDQGWLVMFTTPDHKSWHGGGRLEVIRGIVNYFELNSMVGDIPMVWPYEKKLHYIMAVLAAPGASGRGPG